MSLADKQILKTQAEEERGENARLSIFVGATAIGDMLRTTLGPKGMDKILLRMNAPHNRGFSVTNDGATIMKSIGVDNPAAKILSNVAQTQDNEVGDGTTSVVVLAAELLHQAEKLIAHGLHPQTIIGGWQAAVDVAESVLEQSSFSLYLNSGENSKNTCANQNINKNECYFYQKTNNFNSDQNDPQNSDKNNNQNINYNISNINANSCSKNIDICNQNCGIITQNINKNSNINNICSNNNDIYNNFSDDFIQKLKDLTKVTLSSKILDQEREHFCDLAVKAVLRLKGSDHLDSIHIIKKSGGCLKDSFIDDGFILDKQFGIKPIVKEGKIEGDKDVNSGMTRINDARILLANTPMDYDKIKIFGARVRVDSSAKIAELEAAEKKKMKDKVDNIIKHNVNVFINRQLIYNYPEQLLSDAGVVCIEHADFEGTERLAKVLGAEIVSTFNNPSGVKIGKCKVIEEIMIGEDRLLRFSGVQAGEACTVVLRGSSEHILDEAERALHDALCVLVTVVKEPRFVYGGGCSEILMADAVQKVAQKTAGKEAMAIESFAEALRQLPHAIAENAGLDASELISKLRAMHATGNSTYGIDIVNECPGDMETLKIYESLRVKNRVLISAFEAAEMILRVDDILKCAPRKRENHPRY